LETAGAEIIPEPPARWRDDDPDTIANRAGGFAVRMTEREPTNETVYREGPDGKVVRLVGPAAFFHGE
jgi:hypothetical protein